MLGTPYLLNLGTLVGSVYQVAVVRYLSIVFTDSSLVWSPSTDPREPGPDRVSEMHQFGLAKAACMWSRQRH